MSWFFGRKKSTDQKYLLSAHSYNGFIVAYQKSFLLKGDKIWTISNFKKDRLTYIAKDPPADMFSPTRYTYNTVAERSDPETWEYKLGYSSEKEGHDVRELIKLLKQIGEMQTGYSQVLLFKFDDYHLIHISWTSERTHGTVLGERSALFRYGKILNIPKKIRFHCISEFYRVRE